MAQKRRTLAEGIYADAYGITAIVELGSKKTQVRRKTQRYPLGTDVDDITTWRLRTKADLIEADRDDESARIDGTLAADVLTYLSRLKEGPARDGARYVLGCWLATPLGLLDRHDITPQQITEQIDVWANAGVSVSQLNQRLSRLRQLYDKLGNRREDGPFPTDGIKGKRPIDPEPRSIPMAFVEFILNQMPDRGRAERHGKRGSVSQTKIRLRLMAYTGIPPAQLKRIRVPQHLDFKQSRVYVKPRRKGTGTPGAWLPLLPPAVDAFRDFVRAGLVGKSWSRSSMYKSWKRAIRNAEKALAQLVKQTGDPELLDAFLSSIPEDCRPYDLRHSFATDAYLRGGDLHAVAELLQHSDLETTRRYTKGAVSARAAQTIAHMAAAHDDTIREADRMIAMARHAIGKKSKIALLPQPGSQTHSAAK